MIRTTRLYIAMIAMAFAALTGCSPIGPATMARDRFDYAAAVSNSWKRVMLLNIIKIRYGDAPVFLEVASVVNQYALEAELGADAGFGLTGLLGELGDTVSVGGRARYSDRPTITYTPLVGRELSKSLLTPTPPDELLLLIQSGWAADVLLPVCVTAINGIYNRSAANMAAKKADPEFKRLVDLWRRIQESGGLGARIMDRNKESKSIVFFRRDLDESLAADVAAAKELLGLDPEAHEYNLGFGSIAKDDREIAILTRSMIQITAELAARVEVPKVHIEENRASPGLLEMVEDIGGTRAKVRIRHSNEKPNDAFVAVKYRGYWFYIDDRDFTSKRMFTLLMFFTSLAQKGEPEKGPVLTIPTG